MKKILNITFSEFLYLYIKHGISQPYRTKYLKAYDVDKTDETNLKKLHYLNSGGAITQLGKLAVKDIVANIFQKCQFTAFEPDIPIKKAEFQQKWDNFDTATFYKQF